MNHDSEPTNPPETEDGATERPDGQPDEEKADESHDTLKYHLLGPSLTKSGQDSVDQTKVRPFFLLLSSQPCFDE